MEKKPCLFYSTTKYFLAFLLLFSLCFLASCDGRNTVQNGIEIKNDEKKEYSEKTLELSENIIFELLCEHNERKNEKAPNASELTRLSEKAKRISSIAVDTDISEALYLKVLDELSKGSPRIAAAFAGLATGDFDALRSVTELYHSLFFLAGSSWTGGIVYELCYLYLDECYVRETEEYQASGSAHHKVLADRYKNERDAFREGIGKESFSSLLSLSLFLGAMGREGVIDEGMLSAFSDEEIYSFISHTDFKPIDISPEGYELIFTYLANLFFASDTESYLGELMFNFAKAKNPDVKKAAPYINDVISLVQYSVSSLSTEDIGLIREGEKEELISSIFSRFGSEQWQTVRLISDIGFNSSLYSSIAVRFFGDDFTSYKNSMTKKSFDELYASVGTADFYNTLEGYVFGISPAFSYGMSND